MNLYSHSEWLRFREEVIKLDDGKCGRCFRTRGDGVVLQVHHKDYVPGRRPWEYAYDECETLCKGCHAAEHGLIMPQSGWELLGSDDLGDLDGNCELCGTALRHVFLIDHPNWSAMAVGTFCCDDLTGTTDASEFMKVRQKRKRFVSSPRWQEFSSGVVGIDQEGIWIKVSPTENGYKLSMDSAPGKVEYDSLIDAKMRAFDLIESGEATEYLRERRRKLQSKRKLPQQPQLLSG